MWWFLGVVLALQLYFVRELLAAFALFALGFAAIAFVVVSLYMLQKVWEVGVQRVADSVRSELSRAERLRQRAGGPLREGHAQLAGARPECERYVIGRGRVVRVGAGGQLLADDHAAGPQAGDVVDVPLPVVAQQGDVAGRRAALGRAQALGSFVVADL